jgi:predicted amidohydrolase
VRALSVAAAQAVSIRGAVAVNIEHHCRLAELAAEKGAGVVVFPELSLTGYELDIAPTLAFSAEDERLEPLVAVADASEVMLVVGAPVRLASGLHIGAFVVEPGRSMRVYTKRHLYGSENDVFVPGSLDPILELGADRAALAICADTSHPEHAEAAAKRGASLYLVGVFFDPEGYPSSSDRLAGYAQRHAMAVVMANAGGPATGFASAGRSAVWSDRGALVACLDGVGAGLVVARRSEPGWSAEAVLL